MENKEIGAIIITAIGIVVALVMLVGGITEPVGQMTNVDSVVNSSITGAQWYTNNVITLKGKVITEVRVINGTAGSAEISSTNWSIANNKILSDGTIGAQLTVLSADAANFNASAKRISYKFEPLGYADDAASRAVVGLIVIFAALAVVVFGVNQMMHGALFDLVKVDI